MGTIEQFLTALCPLNLKKIPVICLLLIISAKVEQSNFPYHRQNISNESYNHYKDLYSAFIRNIYCPGTLGVKGQVNLICLMLVCLFVFPI